MLFIKNIVERLTGYVEGFGHGLLTHAKGGQYVFPQDFARMRRVYGTVSLDHQ